MSKQIRWAVSLLVAFSFAASSFGGQRFGVRKRPKPGGPKFVAGEMLVKFKAGVGEAGRAKVHGRHGTKTIYTSPFTGLKRVRIPKGKAVAQVVAALRKEPSVQYAEPNSVCRAFLSPNDPYYSSQWHLTNAEYGGINVEPAWETSQGAGVVVAVLDSGVAYEKYRNFQRAPDLAQTTFVAGYDFIGNDTHPNDDNSHGTHVAGTIAQSTNNGVGVAGVAFACSIMPVKVLDKDGYGTAQTIADGLYYAADNGAKVINMSLGWPVEGGVPVDPGQTVLDAVAYAYGKGVTIVCASGNDGAAVVAYPAAYDAYCIAVGATQYDETRASYSNHGGSLDLVAPGGNVYADQNGDGYGDGVLQNTFNPETRNVKEFDYWFLDGTSMAAPHVSGVAALLIANGVSGPDAVRYALESTAEDLGAAGWDAEHGYGLVDAAAALGTSPPPNQPPVASDDSYKVAVDGQLSSSVPSPPGVLENDTDADGDPLTAVLSSNVSHGSLALNPDGSFTYTPAAGWAGTDSFTYRAYDGSAYSNEATVTIEVLQAYRIPDAELLDTVEFVKVGGEADSLIQDRQAAAGGGALYSIILADTGDGKIGIGDDWELSTNLNLGWDDGGGYHPGHYTSLAAYGCYEMVVSYVDGEPGSSINVNLYLNTGLTGPSGFPSGDYTNDTAWQGDWITLALGETKTVRLDFNRATAYNISDNKVPHTGGGLGWADGGPYAINDRDRHEISNIGLQVADFDGSARSSTIKVVLNGTGPPPPVAANDSAATDEDTPVTIDVLANDSADSLTVTNLTQPANGTAAINVDQTVTYTPDADFNGQDTFTYTANNGTSDSNVATVTVTVAAVNDAPVASDDAYTTDQDTVLNVPAPGVLGNDSDPDDDNITAALVTTTSSGTLTLNADGSFSYTPNAGYVGTDSFTYKATDGQLESNVATASITVQAVVEQPRISGTILLDGTSPLPAIQVKLYWHDGKRWKTAATTETDTDGHYTFAGLSLGVLYKVEPRNKKHTFDPAAYVDVELTEEEPTAVCNFNAYASTSKSPPGKSGTYRRPTDF